jgi:hypothetical protein
MLLFGFEEAKHPNARKYYARHLWGFQLTGNGAAFNVDSFEESRYASYLVPFMKKLWHKRMFNFSFMVLHFIYMIL